MTEDRKRLTRKHLVLVMASAITLIASTGLMAEVDTIKLDIKKQSIGKALMELGESAGVQIMLPRDLGDQIQAAAIQGEFTLNTALTKILAGSGLSYEFVSKDSVVITEIVVAETAKEADAVDAVEEIVVIGSKIITDPGKLTRQMTIYNREEIERSGRLNLEEFLRDMPQNINSTNANGLGVFMAGSAGAMNKSPAYGVGRNVYGASSVNLRGLGEQYTLILIDGQRPAKGGQFGDMVDISHIPINQVERIEVLFDGASSIYGPDAVGGVVNIVTDRNYEGTDLRVDYSATREGGGSRINVGLGHTFDLENGSFTASLNYSTTRPIDASERQYDLFRDQTIPALLPSIPGNISEQGVRFQDKEQQPLLYVQRDSSGAIIDRAFAHALDPDTNRPTLLDPPEGPGWEAVYQLQLPDVALGNNALTLDDITSTELGENLFMSQKGYSLTPDDENIAVRLGWQADVSDSLSLGASVNYGYTEKVIDTDNSIHLDNVSAANVAWNPFAAHIFYAVSDGLPGKQQKIETETTGFALTMSYDVNDDWSLGVNYSYSRADNTSVTQNPFNDDAWAEARLGTFRACPDLDGDGVYDEPGERDGTFCADGSRYFEHIWDSKLNIFDQYLGLGSQKAYESLMLLDDFETSTLTDSHNFDVHANGVLTTLPSGDVRTHINLSRRETKSNVSDDNPMILKSLNGRSIFDYEDLRISSTTTGFGAELSVPIIGENNALPYVNGLLLSLSGRMDDMDNLIDPSYSWTFGLNWQVNDWLTIRVNENLSIAAPASVYASGESEMTVAQKVLWGEDGRIDFFGLRPNIWTLRGNQPGLEFEESRGTSIGFIIRPYGILEGMDFQVNLNESEVINQVGQPTLAGRWTEAQLRDESFVALHPLLYSTTTDTVAIDGTSYLLPDGAPSFSDSDFRLVVDGRSNNIGDSYNRNADLQLGYNLDTEFGQWRLSWRHQYTDYARRVTSSFCENSNCIDVHAVEYDTVGSIDLRKTVFDLGNYAIPEHKGQFSLNWAYAGLTATLNTSYQSATSLIQSIYSGERGPGNSLIFDVVEFETIPEKAVSLNIGYALGESTLFEAPGWLQTTVLTLNLGNIWERKARTKVTAIEKLSSDAVVYEDELVDLNPYALDARGQSINIGFHSTF